MQAAEETGKAAAGGDDDDERRFYLHVGAAKSGTSYLQNVLFASADALAAQGAAMVPPRRAGHFRLAVDVAGTVRPQDPPEMARARERFAGQLARMRPQVGIFSHEVIARASVARARDLLALLDGYEVHVVVTLRDPARMLASSWQQSVQARHTTTLERFLADVADDGPAAEFFTSSQAPDGLVGRWSQVVPPERFHVVVVPPAGSPPRLLLKRFCSAVGLDPDSLVVPPRRGNPALGNVQAELLRRVNVALGDRLPHPRDGYRRVGKNWLAQEVLAGRPQDRPRLPGHHRAWVEGLAEDWIGFLRSSGVQVHGDLEELRADASVFGSGSTGDSDASGLSGAAAGVVGTPEQQLEVAVAALADILALRHDELERRSGPEPTGPTGPTGPTVAARGSDGHRGARAAGRVARALRRVVSDR